MITALIDGSSRHWKGDAVADVLTLMRSGNESVPRSLTKWLVETAGDEHYALIAEDLDRYGESLQYVLFWMKNHQATMAALPALERAVRNAELRRRLNVTEPVGNDVVD